MASLHHSKAYGSVLTSDWHGSEYDTDLTKIHCWMERVGLSTEGIPGQLAKRPVTYCVTQLRLAPNLIRIINGRRLHPSRGTCVAMSPSPEG